MTNSILDNDQREQHLARLQNLATQQQLRLTDLFEQDPQRFDKFSVHFNQLSFDYSKHRIVQNACDALFTFAYS